jgi:hypothetical protein
MMISVQGGGVRLCDGLTRRELLRVGGLTLFASMTLPRLLQASESGPSRRGSARSVILFNLLGGPSHQDMFDLKPDAPAEIRGEFKPIATSLPGVQVCEHLPRTATLMHKATLIRTVTHTYNAHNPLAMMTGFAGGEFNQIFARRRSRGARNPDPSPSLVPKLCLGTSDRVTLFRTTADRNGGSGECVRKQSLGTRGRS